MKHPNFKPHQLAIFSIAGSALLACGTGLFSSNLQAQPQVASPAAEGRRGEAITLNFVNANIDAVARTMATLTGRNVVVDPRVKGNITLYSDEALTPREKEVIALSAEGLTSVEIAERLGMAARTVNQHVDNVADKRYAGSVIVNEGNSRFFEPAPGRTWLAGTSATLRF